ncbi:MAG: asparaginase, partial [Anaerotignaceae bacterium]
MKKNTVVVLATGGTIAGSGQDGKTIGYKSGTLTVEDLLKAVPKLEEVAKIEAVQICNINSDDITSEIWIKLSNTINEMSKDPNVSGFVITHGTDTMEETAYFLNLTVKTNKPVVLTGSMRPSTSMSPDGPMNLYQAVCVANSNKMVGKGVVVAFADKIYSARSVTKISTYHVTAISVRESGIMGTVIDGEIYLHENSEKLHTVNTEFDVSNISSLPKVSIIYFAVDADPEILKYIASVSDGIVIAGAGGGEVSQKYIDVINQLKIPIVISSRTGEGIITQNSVLCKNTVAANNLLPQKAAILLRLALTKTNKFKELVHIFD